MVNKLGEAKMAKQVNANTKLVRAVKQVRLSHCFEDCAVKQIRFGNLLVLVTEKRINYKFDNVAGGISRYEAIQYLERSGYEVDFS
jgi:hypothetical protein